MVTLVTCVSRDIPATIAFTGVGDKPMLDAITYYKLLVKDTTNGRCRSVQGREAIRGRYPAEAERDRMQRENRNPSLVYELERTSAPKLKEAGNESTIMDHHFERKW